MAGREGGQATGKAASVGLRRGDSEDTGDGREGDGKDGGELHFG